MGRSVKRYYNAAQILPKALVEEIQRYAAGKMLYIPYPVTKREINRLKVLDLRMQGYSLAQIAYRTGMCLSNVSKILQRDRLRALAILQEFTDMGESDTEESPGEGEAKIPPHPTADTKTPRSRHDEESDPKT